MVKSPKSHDHDDDEFEECDVVGTNGSCSRSGDGKSKDQKTTAHRSKHSETEQRRRSKINERFQILRDIIPQNDQKRDKASFLLEVIEYIQFLQDKLSMYEGQYHGWSPEPKKLIPWDTPESELGTAAVYKALNHPTGSATPAVPSNLQMKPNIFDPVVRGGVPAWSLQESISDAENMPSQPQSQWWHARPYPTEDATPNNMSEHELAVDSGSVSISSAYSQEILNSLTQELQSSGVDLSQANISVQINVGKSANSGLNAVASNSKDGEKQSLNDQVMAHTAVGSCHNDSGLAHKRLRTEES